MFEAQSAQQVEEGTRLQEGQVQHQEDQEVPQPQPQVNADNIFEQENTKLKKENQFLKNRFEQMQISYNELEKEIDEVKKHCEEELLETRTQFEKMKNELEHSR